ncbi:MAG: hypothetical protein ABEI27_14025 [Halobellus sp.]|uniref:hypothetical protein n=1 Tax=Halobellus sp. TaxID=1979212 RepID=UPI0035D423AE
MSRSLQSSGDADVGSVIVECDAADVEPTDRILDVDQLSPRDRQEILDAVEGSNRAVDLQELDSGDVVRFTEYYRVV